MGRNNTLINELEEVNCETMTVIYENCGVRKEFTGPKNEAIALVKKIRASEKTMRISQIIHPRAAE